MGLVLHEENYVLGVVQMEMEWNEAAIICQLYRIMIISNIFFFPMQRYQTFACAIYKHLVLFFIIDVS